MSYLNVLMRIFVGMSGIYIHIPFCKQKCTYCDFHFSTTFHSYRDQMLETLKKEIILRNDYLADKNLNSIYFGGGTPSLLTQIELESLMATIHTQYSVNSKTEVTLEANPDDITLKNLRIWKNAGINRLSIGLQSFKKEDLLWMNRAHSVDEALNCVQLAQQVGFSNISVDLIYGLPELTQKEWEQHINLVLEMGVQHVSAYCLTVEDKTVLHTLVKQNKLKPVNEDDQSEQFILLSTKLKKAGFLHYEISNFGLPGMEALHNSNYWRAKEYIGIGPSAHSFNTISRRWNIANNSQYLKNFGDSGNWYEEEVLSIKDRWNEMILTGLRTSYGVDLKELIKIGELPADFTKKLKSFSEKKWLLNVNDTIVLTDQGRLMADHITSELFL